MICALCLVPCASLCWRPPGGPFTPLVAGWCKWVSWWSGTGREMRNICLSLSCSNLTLSLCPVPCALCCPVCGTRSYARTARTAPRLSLDRHRLQPRRGDRLLRQDGCALSRHNGSPWREWLSQLKKASPKDGCAAALTTAGHSRAVALPKCSVRNQLTGLSE